MEGHLKIHLHYVLIAAKSHTNKIFKPSWNILSLEIAQIKTNIKKSNT